MVKNGITLNEFLRALRRNVGNEIIVYEDSFRTLEFRTRKCQFKSKILSSFDILLVRRICRNLNVDFVSWDSLL